MPDLLVFSPDYNFISYINSFLDRDQAKGVRIKSVATDEMALKWAHARRFDGVIFDNSLPTSVIKSTYSSLINTNEKGLYVVVAFGGGVTSGRESELMEIGLEVLTNGDGIQNYLKVFSLKTGRFKLPILIVEDLDSPREIIEMYIEQMGYAVKSVASGEVALGLLQADPQGFFCVLTDIKMPNMNGVQFIKFVRQDEQIRHIPVIVLSAYGTGELLLDCLQAGASGFLAKPPRREDIVRELGRARRVALGLESVRLCESDKMSLVRDYLAQKGILD